MDRSSESTNNRYQILVVDDSPEIRKLLQCMLEQLGHDVIAAASGEQALRALNEYSPQVIFSDLSMDEMTGYELVRNLRDRCDTRTRFIVAMTGDWERFSEDKSLAAGFDAHLAKPFARRTIMELLSYFEARISIGTDARLSNAKPFKKDAI